MTDIYHITHFSNLAGIIASGGLFCDRLSQEMDCVKIGHRHIKERRLKREVPLPPGGCVGDYVPFYFAPRSPMLYAIHKGFVEGYNSGQSEVVHLVSSAEMVDKADLHWVFSDGHAEMAPLTAFYNSLEHLDKVDWDLMKSQFWFDTDADPDRKRRRQAEFLVYNFFPWQLLTSIGVYDNTTGLHVKEALKRAGHKPAVNIEKGWYY